MAEEGKPKKAPHPHYYHGYANPTTFIASIDVSNPAKPRTVKRLLLDGRIESSRIIGQRLYLVTQSAYVNTPPIYYAFRTKQEPAPAVLQAKREELQRGIERWSFEEQLPAYRVLGETLPKPVLDTKQLYAPPNLKDVSGMKMAVAIDLRQDAFTLNGIGWLGDASWWREPVYVSQKAIYITSRLHGRVNALDGNRYPHDMDKTLIHKIAFKGDGFDYRGSGAVLGGLGWHGQNSFRLDESRQGQLRVVTSNNAGWRKGKAHEGRHDPAARSPAVLTVMGEHPKYKQLDTYSRLPNRKAPKPLGKPGEKLYAARLFDDFAYFITFKKVDPLYIVDLRNPNNLKVTGELVIPGYSDYLHPLGDGLMFGVGKEADDTTDSEFALMDGLKLSLFDVHNPNHPREVHKLTIGERGTHSPVNHDHHAFTSLAMSGEQTTRVALPISVAEKKNDYGNLKTGLHRFEVDRRTRRIKSRGVLKAISQHNWGWSSGDRSIIIGDKLYYYHDGHVRMGDWHKAVQ